MDLDITDQTADLGPDGTPQPIKVRILASAIVSVGDTDTLTRTAANRYFAKSYDEQMSTLTDLLSSSGRRAVNLLTHDQLFSAKSAPRPAAVAAARDGPGRSRYRHEDESLAHGSAADDDDDPLAIIIRKACSRELTDLGLIFNSLNIKVVQSEVADARRRQSAAEATANAEIVAAQQARRSKEAQLEAQRVISDRQRELEQTQLANAALIAEAEAKKQNALAIQREAELRATQIAQATAGRGKGAHRRAGQGAGGGDAHHHDCPTPTRKASARSMRRSRRAARVISVIVRWKCCRTLSPRLPRRWRKPGS